MDDEARDHESRLIIFGELSYQPEQIAAMYLGR